MKQGGSTFVVFAAMGGNLAIAGIKLGAAFYTGSSAMFTEAIHSFVDTGDQALLLYGLRRSERPPSATHPFGHGLELYFWSFVVALLIFALGGVFAIYEGVEKIRHPEPIESAWVNFVVIGLSLVFEGISFAVAWREMRARFETLPMWIALRRSKDPSTFTVILEDGAALMGLLIALAGVTAAVVFGEERGDGVASVAIGCLLIAVAVFLARETRSLLTGENASPVLMDRVRERIDTEACIDAIVEMKSLQLGARQVLVIATVTLAEEVGAARIGDLLARTSADVKRHLPMVCHLYLVPAADPRQLQRSSAGG